MDASTPLRRAIVNVNRVSLAAGASEFTPLRKSISTAKPLLNESNDDLERLARRNQAQIKKRVSTLAGPSTLAVQSPANAVFSMKESEIKEHFQICTKLHAENKINTKNAWSLQIIDLIRLVTRKESHDTLQVAGTSLDISAKVYGIRVDDVHSDGLKLASSMSRVVQEHKRKHDDDDDDDVHMDDVDANEQGDTSKGKKKKKRKIRSAQGLKHTVAKDPAANAEKPSKLESVFFSSRIDSEASTVENLLSNRLPMNKSGYEFLTLSAETFSVKKPDEAVELEDKEIDSVFPDKGNICGPFNEFFLDKWNPDEEDALLKSQMDNSLRNERNDVVMFDDNGLPIHELDGSLPNIFGDNNPEDLMDVANDDVENEEEVFSAQFHSNAKKVVDLRPGEESEHISEYSYNSVISTHNGRLVDQVWGGPSFWKLKFLQRRTAMFSGSLASEKIEKKGKRKTKAPFQPIDFNKFKDMDDQLANLKHLKPRKKQSVISSRDKYIVPIPSASTLEMLANIKCLMSKPNTVPVNKNDKQKETDLDVNDYDYQNPNDTHYCPNTEAADNDPNDDNAMDADNDDHFAADNNADFEEDGAACAPMNFLRDNLVDAPEAVPKAYVPYALQAKRMDMKKLKNAVWDNITIKTNDPMTKTPVEQVAPKSFSKLMTELPSSAFVSQSMKKDLSCPLVFVALLHLCNEKNLKLQQHQDYKDFDINQSHHYQD